MMNVSQVYTNDTLATSRKTAAIIALPSPPSHSLSLL